VYSEPRNTPEISTGYDCKPYLFELFRGTPTEASLLAFHFDSPHLHINILGIIRGARQESFQQIYQIVELAIEISIGYDAY
jgi:hypothetical protein